MLQPKNIAFRLQHTKFSDLGLNHSSGARTTLNFEIRHLKSKFIIQNQNSKFQIEIRNSKFSRRYEKKKFDNKSL